MAQNHYVLNKISSARCRVPPYRLLKPYCGGSSGTQNNIDCFNYVNCSSGLNDKILWLKTRNTMVERHRERRLEQNCKDLPCWLAFIDPENAM